MKKRKMLFVFFVSLFLLPIIFMTPKEKLEAHAYDFTVRATITTWGVEDNAPNPGTFGVRIQSISATQLQATFEFGSTQVTVSGGNAVVYTYSKPGTLTVVSGFTDTISYNTNKSYSVEFKGVDSWNSGLLIYFNFTINLSDTSAPTGWFNNAQVLPGTSDYYSTKSQTPSFSWNDAGSTEADVYATLNGSAYSKDADITAEGKNTIVLYDYAGNNNTYYLIVDKTAPTGSFSANYNLQEGNTFYAKNNISFAWTNASAEQAPITATVTRNGASFGSFTNGPAGINFSTTQPGKYVITLADLANNSTTYELYLDTTAPAGSISPGTTQYSNSSTTFTWSAAGANEAPIAGCTVNGQSYSSGSSIAPGNYGISWETIVNVVISDKAGNSSTAYIVFDKTAPTGSFSSYTLQEGSTFYANRSISFTWTNASSTQAPITATVTRNGASFGSFTNGNAGVDFSTAQPGRYIITLADAATNSTTYELYLDATAPTGSLSANSANVSGEVIYYSKTSTSFTWSAAGANEAPLTGCTVNGQAYSSGAAFLPGSYGIGWNTKISVRLADKAGNATEYFIVFDNTAPALTFSGVSDSIASGNPSASWNTPNRDTHAPINSVTLNGINYTKDATVYTVKGGRYIFVITNFLGTATSYTIMATKENFNNAQTSIQKWWETVNEYNSKYSFATEAAAQAFAEARERTLVRNAVWSNPNEWDGGLTIDEADAAYAFPGPYYIYRSISNYDREVAYFTLERLNAVIAHYAKQSLSAYHYWQQNPATPAAGEKIYISTDNSIICSQLVMNYQGDLTFYKNNELVSRTGATVSFAQTGSYTFTVNDVWGNTATFSVVIVTSAPQINYSLGNTGSYNALDARPEFYFKNIVALTIQDIDDFAMFIIKDESGKIIETLYKNQTYILQQAGKFIIQSINHFGLSSERAIFVSFTPPQIITLNNQELKKLEISIIKSTEKYTTVQSIKIEKSTDGFTWTTLSADDYNTAISRTALSYGFRTSGYYRITVTDPFRSGAESITTTVNFTKAAPTGTLNGVQNGGYTNTNVTFTWTDDAFATVNFWGVINTNSYTNKNYLSGASLSENGKYEITLKDFDGNSITAMFVIDKTAPQAELMGVNNDGYCNSSAYLIWTDASELESPLSAKVSIDGQAEVDYARGSSFDKEGNYTITVYDAAGNKTAYKFVILKTAPTGILYTSDNKELTDGSITNKTVYFRWAKALNATATLNGAAYFNDSAISAEAEYTLVLTDKAGNTTVIKFIINKSIPIAEFKQSDGKLLGNNATASQDVVLNFEEEYTFSAVLVAGSEKVSYSGFSVANKKSLSFTESGVFEVTLTNSNGISYTYKITINKEILASFTVNGEELNDTIYTNQDIAMSWIDGLYKITITNAVQEELTFDYSLKTITFTTEGVYNIRVENQLGRYKNYQFVILKSAPVAYIVDKDGNALLENELLEGVLYSDFYVYIEDTGYYFFRVFKDKNLVSGYHFSEPGEYIIQVWDEAGNERVYTIIIKEVFRLNAASIVLIVLCSAGLVGLGIFIVLSKRSPIRFKRQKNKAVKNKAA